MLPPALHEALHLKLLKDHGQVGVRAWESKTVEEKKNQVGIFQASYFC